jgi:hypothetical protein
MSKKAIIPNQITLVIYITTATKVAMPTEANTSRKAMIPMPAIFIISIITAIRVIAAM